MADQLPTAALPRFRRHGTTLRFKTLRGQPRTAGFSDCWDRRAPVRLEPGSADRVRRQAAEFSARSQRRPRTLQTSRTGCSHRCCSASNLGRFCRRTMRARHRSRPQRGTRRRGRIRRRSHSPISIRALPIGRRQPCRPAQIATYLARLARPSRSRPTRRRNCGPRRLGTYRHRPWRLHRCRNFPRCQRAKATRPYGKHRLAQMPKLSHRQSLILSSRTTSPRPDRA